MSRGCRAVVLAAAAVIGTVTSIFTPSTARAGDELTLSPTVGGAPLYLDDATSMPATTMAATTEAAPTPDRPLMALLHKEGINTGDIHIYGFFEGGYTASASNPPGGTIDGRVFDYKNEEIILNQADLSIEKVVDAGAAAKDGKWNIGGKVEWIYGTDAAVIHSNGLNFYGGDSPQASPEYQFDLTQAYVDIAVPVGNGLLVRAGKFVTLLGQETINPTGNALYSHSYLFGFAINFTETGVLGTYALNDKTTVTAGITRGWEQSTKDNNDVVDYTGQLKYVFNDKVTGIFSFITGPEEDDNNSLYRTVFDGILTYAASDKWSFALNGDDGWEPDGGSAGQDASWYGLAGYASYKMSDSTTANARLEWFNDPDDARGIGDTVYEATLGLAIKPWPNSDLRHKQMIRPEVRFD